MTYKNREDVGRQLAVRLTKWAHPKPVVVGLSHGGLLVAKEVALAFQVPVEFMLVGEIRAPFNEQLVVAAVIENGGIVVDPRALAQTAVSNEYIKREAERLKAELKAQSAVLREGRPRPQFTDRRVILIDDALTRIAHIAALREVRRCGASETVLAIPAASSSSLENVEREADEVIALDTTGLLSSASDVYDDTSEVTEATALSLVRASHELTRAESAPLAAETPSSELFAGIPRVGPR